MCPTRNRDGLNRLLNGNRNKVYEHVVMVRGRVFDALNYRYHSRIILVLLVHTYLVLNTSSTVE